MQEVVDWLAILLRWGHAIAAISWVGTSFYFNWFDLSVRAPDAKVLKENIRGTLHEVHGGSFYYHEQYWPAGDHPRTLAHAGPAQLTLLTGIALFAIFYWYGAGVYLIDSQVARLSKGHAIILSVAFLIAAWPLYYKLCRATENDRTVFVWMAIATAGFAWLLCNLFGGRAAFIQVGAMLGTIMALSVHFVIVPNHIAMRRQLKSGEPLDISLGDRAKRVSKHNNYFTLPVLFAMLSIHFPTASSHPHNWLILCLIMGAGVALRHYRNVQLKADRKDRRLVVAALLMLLGAFCVSRFTGVVADTDVSNTPAVSDQQVLEIVHKRCSTCHSAKPADANFETAPLGFRLDTIDQIKAGADKIVNRAIRSRDMPLNNSTGMVDSERQSLGSWLEAVHEQPH